ncbi:MAG TPA: NAD(P)H-binding protein, partial [Acidothermaceae bacterium]
MRVLVTGATGYVGGRLVPALLREGDEVRCLTRSAERLRDLPWRSQVEIAEGDVLDRPALVDALRDVDVTYYLVHALGSG